MSESAAKKKGSWFHYAWVIMLATIVMNFFFSVSYSTFGLYAASIYERFPDLSRSAYSFVATIHAASSSVFLLFYGKIVRKIDLRIASLVGGIGLAAGYFLYSVASNIFVFYIGAVFVGMFPAFCSSTTTATLFNRWYGKLHGTLLAVSMTVGGFGGTVGSIYIGRALDRIGYVSTFRTVSILIAVVSVVVFLLIRNHPSDRRTTMLWARDEAQAAARPEEMPGITLGQARKTYNFWAMVIFFVLFASCFYAAYANVPVYMADLGWSATTYGAIFSVVATVNNITMIPGGFVADKVGTRISLLFLALVYILVCVVLGFTTPGESMMYLVCGVIGLAYLFPKILPAPMVREAFGVRDAASIQGILTACITAGAVIGIPAANIVYDLTGSYAGLFKALIPAIAVCVVLGFTGVKKAPGWEWSDK